MSVYVDQLFECEAEGRQAFTVGKKHGHQWCHMWCDPGDEQELHRIAQAIGMKREWFQAKALFPHYDLVPAKRAKAVLLGAVEKSLRQWLREQKAAEPCSVEVTVERQK